MTKGMLSTYLSRIHIKREEGEKKKYEREIKKKKVGVKRKKKRNGEGGRGIRQIVNE